MKNIIPTEIIENRIFLIRKRRVMLDSHLAELYGVSTFRLNEAVKRNRKRFPSDFMFQLDKTEANCLTSQIAISNSGRGGRRTLPYVFTEQGIAMLSSVLRSERAVQVNIMIMRTFVKLREIMATHIDLARKIDALEQRYGKHDQHIQTIFKIIKQLLEPPLEPTQREPDKPPIGFRKD
jgi:hypothetical protein